MRGIFIGKFPGKKYFIVIIFITLLAGDLNAKKGCEFVDIHLESLFALGFFPKKGDMNDKNLQVKESDLSSYLGGASIEFFIFHLGNDKSITLINGAVYLVGFNWTWKYNNDQKEADFYNFGLVRIGPRLYFGDLFAQVGFARLYKSDIANEKTGYLKGFEISFGYKWI